ncbi:hypothetical protein GQ53DRAFT_176501 [Thozetella sp. PMI_491]|nr:hypothetical protein GQ53DRAFT_176501 [Thozetella sp. PMI_491]
MVRFTWHARKVCARFGFQDGWVTTVVPEISALRAIAHPSSRASRERRPPIAESTGFCRLRSYPWRRTSKFLCPAKVVSSQGSGFIKVFCRLQLTTYHVQKYTSGVAPLYFRAARALCSVSRSVQPSPDHHWAHWPDSCLLSSLDPKPQCTTRSLSTPTPTPPEGLGFSKRRLHLKQTPGPPERGGPN